MSLATRAGILTAGNLVYRLSQTVTLIFVVRLISAESVGTYRQAWMVYNSLFVFFLLGLPGSVYHHLASAPPAQHRRFLRQTMILLGLLGAGFAGVLVACSTPLANRLHNPALRPALEAFAPYAFFSIAFAYDYPFFVVYKRAPAAALLVSVYSLLLIAATILALAAGGTLAHAFLAIGAVAAVRYLTTWTLTRRLVAPGDLPWGEGKAISRQLHFAVPVCLADASNALQSQLDKVVASLYYAPAAFAQYSIGAAQLPFVTVVRSAIFAVLLSEISALRAAGDTARILSIWRGAVRKTALVFHPLIVLCAIAAVPLITVLFTSDFHQAVIPFRIYLAMLLPMVFPASSVLLAFGLGRYNLWANVAGMVVMVALGALTVRAFGFVGPALAAVVGQVVIVGLQLRRISRELGVSVMALLGIRSQAGVAWRTLLSALPCLLVSRLRLEALPSVGLQAGSFLVSYLLVLQLTGALTPYERRQLRRLLLPFGLTRGRE